MSSRRAALQVAGTVAVVLAAWLASQRTTRAPSPPPAAASPAITALPSRAMQTAEQVPVLMRAPPPSEPPRKATATEGRARVMLPWQEALAVQPTPVPSGETAAPSLAQDATNCLTVGWTTSMLAAAPGQVLVEITAENRCDRDFGPLDVWFEVRGWREGSVVSIARGHPFEEIRRGHRGTAVIALPGSTDWMDRIDVRVLPAT